MGVFTFVCKSKGGEWTAKQHEGDLEASASSTYDLQRKLVQLLSQLIRPVVFSLRFLSSALPPPSARFLN
ncbi:hypothetical protein F2Q70_00007884 [Brassica cretica]|uniref:60S acidic ribosomal protein P3 n=2 Tax=Brassica cretica TaxID=69181 RepID=A0A8S9J5F8_BRACR|nr:hypothetical protein F2Q68_00000907 [Brassica cretica]KAF2611534.1 hypothetical protein F2Q70_00007884 [Brassica cretica]KAF3551999.1 hypothetical protein DY000_02001202 [Brassica cretica]